MTTSGRSRSDTPAGSISFPTSFVCTLENVVSVAVIGSSGQDAVLPSPFLIVTVPSSVHVSGALASEVLPRRPSRN